MAIILSIVIPSHLDCSPEVVGNVVGNVGKVRWVMRWVMGWATRWAMRWATRWVVRWVVRWWRWDGRRRRSERYIVSRLLR